jgi:hypothetical protein
MKDYYDIWLLTQQFDFDGANLVRAIEATFRRRRAVLPTELPIGLSIEFVSDAGKLSQWDAFVRRSRYEGDQSRNGRESDCGFYDAAIHRRS